MVEFVSVDEPMGSPSAKLEIQQMKTIQKSIIVAALLGIALPSLSSQASNIENPNVKKLIPYEILEAKPKYRKLFPYAKLEKPKFLPLKPMK
ncbi:MAG: hypothetical protein HRU27_14200 [Rhizobiaceae bacterium]|nr:hypothetical protein [Hyphomicrobiales bacterium]NRB31737.1 hypothetical protein [Rhizobiaceae bacterium]